MIRYAFPSRLIERLRMSAAVVELGMPEILADDGDVIVAGLVVLSVDGATELGRQLQSGEEPVVDFGRSDAHRR